jgi:hypothetical protein
LLGQQSNEARSKAGLSVVRAPHAIVGDRDTYLLIL